jgi:putative membrane protein
MSGETRKILILCIDVDNDIGEKCNIQTPLLGRDKNVTAAAQLALSDPEEADANSMFSAVKTYDTLLNEAAANEEYQIATIAGSKMGGVKADKEVGDQLLTVLNKFPAQRAILITDGFADEAVVPIVRSYLPIMSLRRVVVRHSETIEESWALLSRYLKRLIEDPYYSRWVLGAPGILLIVLGFVWFIAAALQISLFPYAGIISIIFIGLAASVKGFNIDDKISKLSLPNPPNLVRIFALTAFFIIIAVDIYQTYVYIGNEFGPPGQWINRWDQVLGTTIQYSTDLIVVAIGILLIGRAVSYYFTRDTRLWWTFVGIVVSAWMREVAHRTSAILVLTGPTNKLIFDLLISVILGMITTVSVVLIIIKLSKRYQTYFKSVGSDSE